MVSTTGQEPCDFTDVYGGAIQQSNIDATFKQFILPTVQSGAKYVKLICFGRINATTEANTSGWNTIREIKFYKEGTTASTLSNELSQISLYPSLANNQLSFKDFNGKISKIEIYNVLGKKIITANITNSIQSINTSNLVNGMYLVKLSDENNISATKKIIIQH